MGNIIAAGMEKKFQLKVFEDDQLSSKLSSYIAGEGFRRSPLAKCTRIDPNNFYRAKMSAGQLWAEKTIQIFR